MRLRCLNPWGAAGNTRLEEMEMTTALIILAFVGIAFNAIRRDRPYR